MIKKILLGFVITSTLFLTGCEEKNIDLGPDVNDPRKQEVLEIWTDSHGSFLEALGREFVTTIQRTNLKVKVLQFNDFNQLNDFLVKHMAEGNGPDVIYTQGSWIMQNHPKLIPRSADPTFMPEDFARTFVRSANESLIAGMDIYGVPLGVDSLALYYNHEHILDRLATRNVPGSTWKEIQEDTENLSTPDNSFSRFSSAGIALGRFDNVLYSFDILSNMLVQLGGNFFAADGVVPQFYQQKTTIEGKTVSIGVEAVNLFTSFADPRFKYYSWSEFLSQSGTRYQNFESFAKGDVSMVFGYSRDFDVIKSVINNLDKGRQPTIPANNVRVTFFPQITNPDLGGTRKILAKVYGLAVPRSATNPELAWEFLKFSVGKDNLQSFFDETKLPTPRVDMIKAQEVHPESGIFVRQAKFARIEPIPAAISIETLEQGFANVILPMNQGKSTADRGLKALEINISQVIQDYIKLEKQIEPAPKEAELLVE